MPTCLRFVRFPERARRAEEELWAQVERERPRIFGVLLDVISHGLRRAPDIRPNKLPRMADFAKWAMACETALWRAVTFQKAYDANQGEAVEVLIEGDQVATAIKKLMSTRIEWEGTATALKEALETVAFGADPGLRRLPKTWPTDAAHLAGAVRRGAGALRKAGIYVSRGTGRERRRIYITTVRPSENLQDQPSPASRGAEGSENNSGGNGIGRDASFDGATSPQCHRKPLENKTGNAGDAGDADFHTQGCRDVPPSGDDGLGIPDFLDRNLPSGRRPTLGPEGDSLDDLKPPFGGSAA